jgi:alpha-L-rhamnosidase
MPDVFDPFSSANAAWIWCDAATRPHHNVVCFRRTFDLDAVPRVASIAITADSRYELFVNGAWPGFGPRRSWPSPWPVDEYDVASLLRPDTNVVAVLVHHPGLSTFQYLHADAGLIATIAIDGKSIGTDAAWRARPHDGHAWPVPRISCMQPWEEQFDARALGDWTTIEFDDSAWRPATPIFAAGQGPHDRFERRAIPFLTREPRAPKRLLSVEAVRPPTHTWSLNLRDVLNAQDKTAEHVYGRMIFVATLHSDAEQPIEFHPPHGRPYVEWQLNGERLKFDDHSLQRTDTGVARARLRAGANTLMGRLPSREHYFWASLNAWAASPVRVESWQSVGPFADEMPKPYGWDLDVVAPARLADGSTVARFDAIWARGTLDADDAGFATPLPSDAIAPVDVYATSAGDRAVPGVTPRVDEPLALLGGEAWATIHPVEGADPRVLLDFGDEVVGFTEFEIDAPAGTIVDNHNFEFIQRDGRFNLAEGMNNSLRYTSRDGAQRYRTLVRRGFRYSWLTFRNLTRPIRVRGVRVLMSTYPQAGQGEFACADARLDQIWQVGAHTVRCCSEDTYTDCPTYEQTFWVGDARNEALVDLVANGDPRLSSNSLRVAARSLDRSPLVESQVPSGWRNVLPAWSFLWMRWAREHFELTGDVALVRELLPWLDRNVDGIESGLSPRGLYARRGWNLFDWAKLDTPPDGEVTHVSCLAVLALRDSAAMAASIDARREASRWSALADRIGAAVDAHLWDEARGAYVDCVHAGGRVSTTFSQQTQTAAFIAGVPASAERLARCRDAMLHAPAGFVTAGSPFFMFFLLEGLAKLGRWDELVGTIRDYWGKQIDAGATTFWETYAPGEPRLTRSHCHGWSAAPTYFLTRYVLGVSPARPGYASVLVEPRPAGGVTWARGRVPTPRGAVGCDWSLNDDAFRLRLTLPAGTTAQVRLPVGGRVEVRAGNASNVQDALLDVAGDVVDLVVRRGA